MATQDRPASVSFVVILTWITAILTIIGGLLLVLANDATLEEAGVNAGNATLQGWVAIAMGVVIALFASALGNGSRFARLLITLLMMFRFVLGVIGMIALWGTSHLLAAGVTAGLALLVLYLLWNSKASAFFAK